MRNSNPRDKYRTERRVPRLPALEGIAAKSSKLKMGRIRGDLLAWEMREGGRKQARVEEKAGLVNTQHMGGLFWAFLSEDWEVRSQDRKMDL